MTYRITDLSVLACANGFTLWHYRTEDTKTAVTTLGYFNDAHDMLRAGDIILANTAESDAAILLVRSNTDGAVSTSGLFL